MPGWAKYDVEDLPQIEHTFFKSYPVAPAESFSLFFLTNTLLWRGKHKLRNLRPPVRASPHA